MNKKEIGTTVLVGIVILILCVGFSWLITCGIIELITICFGLTFNWATATGIWLILGLLGSVFRVTINRGN